MRIITAPEKLVLTSEYPRSLFLLGGITRCPLWQDEVLQTNFHGWNILNPRRPNFDITNRAMSDAQVDWEFDHLEVCDAILGWFAEDEIQPISLFELGSWIRTSKPMIIGCHPNYPRRWDVEKQMSRRRPLEQVHNNLGNVIMETLLMLKKFR